MTATNREKEIYGSGAEIVRREDDCTVYRLANNSGDVVMTSYEVFPGIALVYDDVHTQQCSIDQAEVRDVIEINHCREGRIECALQNEYHYLFPGDVAISGKKNAGHDSCFSGSHPFGGKNVAKMIEYRLIPLMTCSVKIGEELSAAAYTRGLGGTVQRTNICKT